MRSRSRGWPRRRVVVPVVVVAVLVVAAGATWLVTRGSTATAATTTRLVPVSTTTLRQTVAASGTIEPASEADLSFGVSGTVTTVTVQQGQKVAKGQSLATVSSASLAAQLAAARAALAGDQARLSSDQSSSASAAQLAADQAAVTAAQSQVDDAQSALGAATLTSPIDGTVASVNLSVGDQVSGSGGAAGSGGSAASSSRGAGGTSASQAGSGSASGSSGAQVVVVDTTRWVVQASVDDTVVGRLKKGLQAVITPNGATAPVYGLVSSVGLLPTSGSGAPSYPVGITVTGNPPGLVPGAAAQVSIIVKQLADVLAVPASAVHYSPSGTTVTVVRGGRTSTVAVTLGASEAGRVQVVSGLSAGDQVVVTTAARSSATNGTGGGTPGGRGGFGGGGFGGRGGGLGGGGLGGGGFRGGGQ